MQKCSYCGQVSADEAVQCPICATPLREAPVAAQTVPEPVRLGGRRLMRRGAIWCVGGMLVTGVTYASAVNSPTGGTYFVAWGAILFGALQFYRGWRHRDDQAGNSAVGEAGGWSEDAAYRELARATALETAGKIPEAREAYARVMEKYPHSEARKDAAISLASLDGGQG